MNANADRHYRIGEVSDMTGVNRKAIRFYESTGVLPKPRRTPAGYRLYGPGDVQRLQFVRRAKAMGLSLDDIREVISIRDGGQTPCAHVRGLIDQKLTEVRARLQTLRQLEDELVALRQRAEEPPPPVDGRYCGILESSE